MDLEHLDTQVNLENQEIPVILVNQENLGSQEDLVKMVLMEAKRPVLNALKYMYQKESLVTQENQENVENLDLEDLPENQVKMPSAFLEKAVKMVNQEGLDNLEKMVCLEYLAMTVNLENTMT